jgi:hypothetical protein
MLQAYLSLQQSGAVGTVRPRCLGDAARGKSCLPMAKLQKCHHRVGRWKPNGSNVARQKVLFAEVGWIRSWMTELLKRRRGGFSGVNLIERGFGKPNLGRR